MSGGRTEEKRKEKMRNKSRDKVTVRRMRSRENGRGKRKYN